MPNTTNTTSYLDPPSLIGRQNNDGTISLTPLELKRLNDFNYAVSKMIQGGLNLANLNADTNQVFTDIEGNVTSVQATAAGLTTRVSSAEGDISSLEQTASGLSSTVSNLSGEVSNVSQTISGLQVTTSGGTTYISGDHIKSGTIEGVELISANTSSHTRIAGGNVLFGGVISDEPALMYYEPSTEKLRINCGTAIKIEAGTNMSIDAGGTLYLQANGGDINIGNGGNIRLNGTVMVNGVPYAPAGG